MATRLYPTTTAADISPAFDSGWEVTTGANHRAAVTGSGNYSSDTTSYPNTAGSGVANDDVLAAQLVYGPIAAGAITGTFKGQNLGREANAAADARAQIIVRVFSADGSTSRGTLLAMDTAVLSSEFTVDTAIRTNRKVPRGGAQTLSSVTAQAGDYVVIEYGHRNHGTNTGAIGFRGAGTASVTTDLPEDETTTVANDTGIYRDWFEFSATIPLTTLVTPTTATLTLATFAPTVGTSQTATPSTLALSLTTFAPTISIGVSVTPTTLALTLATFAPDVTVQPIPAPSVEARIGWRPDQFNHVTNPGFETNTTGWSVSADINGAATSITRITTDFHSGTACGRLICPATALTGVNYNFGTQPFYAVATYMSVYRFVVWLKSVSGTTQARLIVGSIGTSADRASRDVTLTTDWQPFYLDWAPTGTRTDVELAVVNIPAVAMTALIDDVSFFLRDALTQVENGYFTTVTSGWSVSASINAAGTSITRQSSGGYYGVACGRLVTTATSGSGMNWLLGTIKFTSGRTYRLRVWLKSVSGTTSARIRLGSIGTAADRGDSSVTLTTSWAAYTVDWTPSADRTDAAIAITNGAAAVMTADCDGIELYEAIDDISTDAFGVNGAQNLEYGRGASFDGSSQATGFATVRVVNAMVGGKYTPDNASGVLYGLLEAGRPVLLRARYSGAVYALFFGSIDRIVASPMANVVELQCVDPMDAIQRMSYAVAETANSSVAARTAALVAQTIYNVSAGSGAIENAYAYHGTEQQPVSSYLEELNKATGSLHFARPSVYASVAWQLVSIDRTVHSDSSTTSETWNDDLSDLSGYDVTREAMVNRQRVAVTAYRDAFRTSVVEAHVPESHSPLDEPDGAFFFNMPGVSGTVPPDVLPMTIPANETRKLLFTFNVPMTALSAAGRTNYVSGSATESEAMTAQSLTLTLTAGSSDAVVQDIYVLGTPLFQEPLNDADEKDEQSIWLRGERQGGAISSVFIQHPAYASALALWRVWRYKAARARPSLLRHNLYVSQLSRELGDRVSLTFARLSLSSKPFEILSFSTTVSQNARDWQTRYVLDELPTAPSGGWFVLDSSALDSDDVLAY